MMIFDQKLQKPTMHSLSYGAKGFADFWAKRAYFEQEIIEGVGL